MTTKKKAATKTNVLLPEKPAEIKPPVDPEDPLLTVEEDPDIIPDEEMETIPPYEPPPEGEGP